jgi:rRNA processing protein Gar1
LTEEYVSNKDNLFLTMELLGEILHFSKSGRLIIKVDKNNVNHRPGSQVYTEGERKVGKIAELIGPVESPYASVLPFIQSKSKMSGAKVFTTAFLKNSRNSRSKKSIRRNKK